MTSKAYFRTLFSILLVLGPLIFAGAWIRYQTRVMEAKLQLNIVPTPPATGFILINQLPPDIEITIRGSRQDVNRLRRRELAFHLKLASLAQGVHTLSLNHQQLKLPQRISLVKVSPEEIILELAPEMTKQVPVQIKLTGEAAKGYDLVDYKIIPSEIILRGPRKALAPLTRIGTKAIDINGMEKSFEIQMALALPEMTSLDDTGASPLVSINVTIEPRVTTRIIEGFTVQAPVGTELCATVDPPLIDLTLNGPANQLQDLTPQNIVADVDLQDLEPGVYVRSANIQLPVGVTLLKAWPKIFTVRIVAQTRSKGCNGPIN